MHLTLSLQILIEYTGFPLSYVNKCQCGLLRRDIQRQALRLALDLEDRLVLALEVGLGECKADIAVDVVVDHALVGGDECEKAHEDGRNDLLELHIVF